jgi:hypothetical protein
VVQEEEAKQEVERKEEAERAAKEEKQARRAANSPLKLAQVRWHA